MNRSPVLTRRQTLQSLAYSTIFGGPLLSLVGCGGGGHHGGGSSTDAANVAVTLPTGFSIPATDLTGGTAYGTAAMASGVFKAKVSSKGPTFAYLQQKSTGKYVLFGLAGTGGTGISAMSSAVALIAIAYGVGLMSPVEARALVALIGSNPATATLAGVIEARVAADPYALTDGDAHVQSAVQAAFASLAGTADQAAQPAPRADPSPLVLIQPQDQSGSAVLQKDTEPAIFPVNRIRRPAAVYTYQTGYVAADGTATNFPTAVEFAGIQDLAPTTSITGSLASLGVRPAFGPVNGNATTLKTYSDTATKTLYETVILMASGKQDGLDPDPTFFSEPKYANAVAGWKTKRQELNTHAVFGAILFDLFSSVVGGLSTWVSYSVVAAAVADLEAAGAEAAQMVVRAATGDVLGATLRWFHGATDVNAIASAPWKRSIAEVLVKAEGFSEAAISAEFLTAIGGLAAYVAGCLAATGTILGLGDVAASYKDMLTSDKADLWTETVLKPSVVISPASAKIDAGSALTLAAATPGVSETLYKFHWTLSAGGNGNIGDPDGMGGVGHDVTTAGNSINLLTAKSDVDGAVYAITVSAIDLKTGETLGAAKATITISKLVEGNGRFSILDFPKTVTYNGQTYTTGALVAIVQYPASTPPPANDIYGIIGTGPSGLPPAIPDGTGGYMYSTTSYGEGDVYYGNSGQKQMPLTTVIAEIGYNNYKDGSGTYPESYDHIYPQLNQFAAWTWTVTPNDGRD